MGNDFGDGFDTDRELMKMMLDGGRIPTGRGTFVEIRAETAERIKQDIEAGASFSSDVDEVQYGEPEAP